MKYLLVASIVTATGPAWSSGQTDLSDLFRSYSWDHQEERIYSCADIGEIAVTYVQSGANALALIPIKGETRMFAQVLSASGARYVAGRYEWWSKGNAARFSDQIAETSTQCVSD